MNKKVILIVAIALVAVIAVFGLASKVLSGVFTLANGAFNTVLAVIVIIALIIIVIWMFAYAKSHRKE